MSGTAQIGRLCHAALVAEVDATPKPGLVDRANNGAHADMDHTLFVKSADALLPYFESIAEMGKYTATLPTPEAFAACRPLGVQAERDMFEATGGVNTHKGAIFSLGLLAAAAGRLAAANRALSPDSVCEIAAAFTQGICARELYPTKTPATKGERAYLLYGAFGVRGEAEAGFQSVRNIALPVYQRALHNGANENDALLHALLSLMAQVLDTNVLTRQNGDMAAYTRAQAAAFLSRALPVGSQPWRSALKEMDTDFIARNISPGGCADLIACAHFLYALASLYAG